MKHTFLTILMASSLTVFSQSLQVTAIEQHLESENVWDELETKIIVENISDNSIEVKVSKEEISLPAQGSINYFCWAACYGAGVNISPDPLTIDANGVNDTSLAVYYEPTGNEGQLSVKYCAYNINNAADSACTIIHFNVETSTEVNDFVDFGSSEFHPNPTSSTTILSYNPSSFQNAEILFLDIMGNVVKKHQLLGDDGQLKFSVSDLKAGIYFANIVVDGKLEEIKRLVVTK